MTAPRWPAAQQSPGVQSYCRAGCSALQGGGHRGIGMASAAALGGSDTITAGARAWGLLYLPFLGKGQQALKGSSFPMKQLSNPSNMTICFLFRTNSSGKVRTSRKLTESAWQIFFAQSSWCFQSVTQLTAREGEQLNILAKLQLVGDAGIHQDTD